MSSVFSASRQNLQKNFLEAWPHLLENPIKNYQGYQITFTVFEKRIFCTVEKDSIIRKNIPVVALSDYEFSEKFPPSNLITFDQFHRILFLGERGGLKGGGCCQSKGGEGTDPLLGGQQRNYLSVKSFPLEKALAQLGQRTDEEMKGFLEAKLLENSYYKISDSEEKKIWEKQGSESIVIPKQIDRMLANEILKKIYSNLTFLPTEEENEEVEDSEESYYAKFDQAYELGNSYKQVFYLEKIANKFLQKKDYLNATHFFNQALAAAKLYGFDKTTQEKLLLQLESIEALFLELSSTVQRGYLKNYQNQLTQIRLDIKETIEKRTSFVKKHEEITQKFKNLLKKLIEHCISLLQESAPTSYAVICFGSMARKEMGPYSDVEFAFLLKEDTEPNRQYFRKLSRLIELRMVNLGETFFPVIQWRKVEKVYFDPGSLTRKGFSLDKGGVAPLGKEGIYELIGDPKTIASFQKEDWMGGQGEIPLINALMYGEMVMGDPSLLTSYFETMRGILNNPCEDSDRSLRETRALELLKGHIQEFAPYLGDERILLRGFDTKKDLYRPLQMSLAALALYYGFEEGNTYNIIGLLQSKGYLSSQGASNLQKALENVSSLRIRSQVFYSSEKAIMYHKNTTDPAQNLGLMLFSKPDTQILLEIYRVLIPYRQKLMEFLTGKSLSASNFYEEHLDEHFSRAEASQDYQAAEQEYERVVALNPNDPRALENLQRIKLYTERSELSLKYSLEQLALLKRKHGDKAHTDLVICFNHIGGVYKALQKHEKAQTYFSMALEMQNKLSWGGGETLESAIIKANQGVTYVLSYDFSKGLALLEEALEGKRRILGRNQPHLSVAFTLMHIGNAYMQMQNFPKALEYSQQALAMYKQILSVNEAHLDLALVLMNLGSIYLEQNELMEAKKYSQEASQMYDRVLKGKNTYLGVAGNLMTMGKISLEEQNPLQAKTHLEKALQIQRQILGQNADHLEIAACFVGLGGTYYMLQDVVNAKKCCEDSLAMHQRILGANAVHLHIAAAHMNLGGICLAEKNMQKSIEHSQKSLEMYRKISHLPSANIAGNLLNLGSAYLLSQQFDQARIYLDESLEIYKKILGNNLSHINIAKVLMNRGLALSSLKKFQEAKKDLEESLQIFKTTQESKLIQLSMSLVLERLGYTCVNLGDFNKAITYFEGFLEVYKKIHGSDIVKPNVATALHNLGGAYRQLRNPKKALEYYQKAQDMHKKIPGEAAAKKVAELTTTIEKLKNEMKAIKN